MSRCQVVATDGTRLVAALGAVLCLVASGAGPMSTPARAQTAPTACPARDVPPTDFVDEGGAHRVGIRCVVWYGVAAGRSPTRFATGEQLTRGELATLLARAVEASGVRLAAVGERAFDDTAGSAHGDRLEQLAAIGVVSGTAPRTASPSQVLSRGQLAAFVVRAVEHVEERRLSRGPDAFADDDGSTHEPAIDKAANAGLVAGVTDAAYRHWDPMQRGQVATILSRLLDRFVRDGRLTRPATPTMRWEAGALPEGVRREMAGVSMHPGCPVGYDDLRLVVLTHRGFDGLLHRGEIVVHRTVVADLRSVFARMYATDFPLQRVERIERYGGDDDRSMAANNTSAFNCRRVAGTTRYSEHALGTAIDVNPVQNPYVSGSGTVAPPAGRAYTDRGDVRPGMIVAGDAVVRAFDAIGWGWGGRWSSAKDYQHFSASGR
ncbi:M15 family metallopeptidase [Egicoccus sp. AB-alg6-2]|uniref:M15 family metallopeptidase n=1 Tax=Egicoccus sp. AB-alg6-2 TaxID=3242692 RepID=UPI00359E04B3